MISTILAVCVIILIFWAVQLIIIDNLFWSALITALIVFFFLDFDAAKKEWELKTETEIKQSIDVARDAAVAVVDKISEEIKDTKRQNNVNDN